MRSIISVRSGFAKLSRIVIPCAALLAHAAGCAADADDGPAAAVSAGLGAGPALCANTADIVVSDDLTFGPRNGGVIRIDPLSGTRSTLSQNRSPAGPIFDTPQSLVFDGYGQILVADSFSASATPNPGIMKVDPVTGLRTVLSNNTTPPGGPTFVEPMGIAIESTGMILVADMSAFAAIDGGVFRVDPSNGARMVLSTNGSPPLGPRFENPRDVAVAPDGLIYVVDAGNMTTTGQVISVDPVTGRRRVVSQNVNPAGAPRFVFPRGITVDATGSILVSDSDAFGGDGGIIRVDPATGTRTTVSSNASASGPAFRDPGDLVVDSCGGILVTDSTADAVYRVDATTGVRSVVSDNATPSGTPTFASVYGIAVKPAPIVVTPPGTGGSPDAGQD